MDLGRLSQVLALTEKEVLTHLPHVQKSIASQGGRLVIIPACCDGCGYEFKSRRRISPPGRCPECKHSRISGPWYAIAP